MVAFGRGGALETVVDGETGVLFTELTAESMRAGLERVAQLRVDLVRLRTHAGQFSRERHMLQMRNVIDDTVSAAAGARW